MNSDDQKNLSIACKSEIPQKTTPCPICSCFQKNWMNRLRYLATISAAITLISAAVYFIRSVPEIVKIITWKDDIQVLSLKTTSRITLANIGEGDVFITNLRFIL
jgi:hypothetical protein